MKLLNFTTKKKLWSIADSIFPPYCAGCNLYGEVWCDACRQKSLRNNKVCPFCDRNSYGGNICDKCKKNPSFFDGVYAHGLYLGRLQRAIHNLKYNRNISFGLKIGEEIGEGVKPKEWDIDFVIPIPLSKIRMKERGYNQVDTMTQAVAHSINVPVNKSILFRVKNTSSQVGLTLKQRVINVNGAFSVKSFDSIGNNILVVDDVFTTGSTLNEAANVLKQSGAKNVYVVVCATVP